MPHRRPLPHLLLIPILTFLLAACASPTLTPTPRPPTPTQPASTTPIAHANLPDPTTIALDGQGLVTSWKAVAVPEIPFGQYGPFGLPAHIQILFNGISQPQDREPGGPVIYIMPVEAYRHMWESNDSMLVPEQLDRIQAFRDGLPQPVPTRGLPVLPPEETIGINDLATQLRSLTASHHAGFRFVGRFTQEALPVTNAGLRYIYQGLTPDDQYLIAFFFPVRTDQLPDDLEAVPQAEQDALQQDGLTYLDQKAQTLDTLSPDAWSPHLTQLDALIQSLAWNPPGH